MGDLGRYLRNALVGIVGALAGYAVSYLIEYILGRGDFLSNAYGYAVFQGIFVGAGFCWVVVLVPVLRKMPLVAALGQSLRGVLVGIVCGVSGFLLSTLIIDRVESSSLVLNVITWGTFGALLGFVVVPGNGCLRLVLAGIGALLGVLLRGPLQDIITADAAAVPVGIVFTGMALGLVFYATSGRGHVEAWLIAESVGNKSRVSVSSRIRSRYDLSGSGDAVFIGRDAHAVGAWGRGIVIHHDQSMEPRHAQIVREYDHRFVITNLAGRSLTVNDIPISRNYVLSDGDRLVIGSTRFTFHERRMAEPLLPPREVRSAGRIRLK